ncbi:BZ3500_MvSof-1268-A1-R1_Chr9g10668 [Microbotryum saponariae]|uniref:BZ3500_MvSof-1268-A1-R1_Chr9g10668 protein n=1 Tax=Microbotryum saponariae TaxID=289078 RepID=A0A2X0N6R5_9BASI|nr:BZ3501_MvSof-1269-A2-R1_Chr9g10416 [Microbotryum saponariae]SDA00487.1 BZ3500_MvSof-1268-A1-R1_Chr9g10668 [Microbotryum saponariae]
MLAAAVPVHRCVPLPPSCQGWFRVSHRTFPSDHGRTRISLCQTAWTTALCPPPYACQA